ncbi:MAG TPA: hypothetical protein VGZ52_08375, partial [Acidimicrobiales bacterium]|nr:hypothetical protein [Acidimicrobiales bacterium]
PKGLTGREAQAQGMIVAAKIPAEFKPATAIVDSSIIQDKVAVANYATGQILVDGMFADPIESQITFAGRVPNDCAPAGLGGSTTNKPVPCVGITISVDQTKGVAGVIVPGDYVNVLVLPKTDYCKAAEANVPKHDGADNAIVSNPANPGQPGVPNDGGVTICSPARYLYQAARVLFVDKTAVPQPGEVGTNAATPNGTAATSVNTGLITLEVPARAAQLIASVTPDSLYLTLLPANYTPEAIGNMNPFPSVLPGEDPNQLTPYGPQGFQGQK